MKTKGEQRRPLHRESLASEQPRPDISPRSGKKPQQLLFLIKRQSGTSASEACGVPKATRFQQLLFLIRRSVGNNLIINHHDYESLLCITSSLV